MRTGLAAAIFDVDGVIQGIWDPLSLEDRFCILYLVSTLGLLVVNRVVRRKPWTFAWTEPAVGRAWRLDALTFIVQKLLLWIIIGPAIFLWNEALVGFLAPGTSETSLPLFVQILELLLALVVMDAAFFIAHVLQHRIPALWVFHRVHHSAEHLNPFTAYRVHPVDDVLSLLLASTFEALLSVASQKCFGARLPSLGPHIPNPGLILFYLAGFHFRHSEIPLSFGVWFSKHFVSPVQHQWHHAYKAQGRDIHFGFMLSWWDRLYGSYRVPQSESPKVVGTSGPQHPTVLALLLRPWAEVLETPRGALWAFVLGGLLAVMMIESMLSHRAVEQRSSVYLEELRSGDVQAALSTAPMTLIIPTGGVEQNGSHMSLGKHNAVIRASAGRLAERLGHTLVAPVVPYVPNGSRNPPTGHMQFKGSFSIDDSVYQHYLFEIVDSARIQGFKYIILMHAHGESQWAEHIVQEAMATQHPELIVWVADSYYDEKTLRQRLKDAGFSESVIGTHAGMIDTSELLAVAPDLVWVKSLGESTSGQSGDARLASVRLGESFLEARIQATEESFRKEVLFTQERRPSN